MLATFICNMKLIDIVVLEVVGSLKEYAKPTSTSR